MKGKFSYIFQSSNPEHWLKSAARGFSLVEMLVALCIISIISSTSYSFFSSLSKSYATQTVASGVQQRVRSAIDYMIRDIRLAGLDPLRTAGSGVVSASGTAFSFTADKNLDGDTDDAAEDITYSVAGGILQLTDDQGTETLSRYVTDLSFTYSDKDGLVTMNTADIRSVEISMTVRESAGRGKSVTRTFNTQVRCRNIGL
jgi:type IV pilus assembly protein PilW